MLRLIFQELTRYLLVAPFPHLTTLKVSGLALLSWGEARVMMDQSEMDFWAFGWLLLVGLFVWGVVLCQADALSRYREYRRMRTLLKRYGFRTRIFCLFASSRCQRDAALFAACEAGCSREARSYFRMLGYRWYHILPDAIIANPLFFFHPRFLRSTFLPRKRC